MVIPVKFESKYNNFYSQKCLCKCCPENSGHFAHASTQKWKGHQGDSPNIHWRRWRQASMFPMNTKVVTLTTFPFLCICEELIKIFILPAEIKICWTIKMKLCFICCNIYQVTTRFWLHIYMFMFMTPIPFYLRVISWILYVHSISTGTRYMYYVLPFWFFLGLKVW